MKKQKKYKPRFFPFSAGIPWSIERGKYIIPEMSSDYWFDAITNKNIIIIAFGNEFESFFSLSVAEVIHSLYPSGKLYWIGNSEYEFFVRAQGLCQLSDIQLNSDILKNYPVPLFFDKNNNVYFNVLNNYLTRYSYWCQYPEKVNLPVTEQIFRNSMTSWNNNIPRLRKLDNEFYIELTQIGKIKNRGKICVIILRDTDNDLLGWNNQNIREFAQLIGSKGVKVILFSDIPGIFYGSKILEYRYDLRKILQVICKSWLILSNDINWLMISLVLTEAKIISKQIDGAFDLFKNAEYLNAENDIFTDCNFLSPIDTFTICQG